MTIFQLSAIILTLVAAGGYINHRYIRFPATIGHMAFALVISLAALALGEMGWLDIEHIRAAVGTIDFSKFVLHGILAFLLFAGALHINLSDLKNVALPVGVLATGGVIMAVAITGTLAWLAARFIGVEIPYIYALLFGALISPTDPIAVLSILRQVGVSRGLYTQIGCESLFNDGVGVVVFLALLSVVENPETASAGNFIILLLRESVGGIALGCMLGWFTHRLLGTINDYKVEVMLTLGLVAGGAALAEWLHVSAPLSMVAAGLIIGNQGRASSMSVVTRKRLDLFWELIDEILNAVLFFLVGLEILLVPLTGEVILLGIACIAAVLAGRSISVALPIAFMRLFRHFEIGTIRLLTWGGLRGGLSIAMALSLPDGPEKPVILAMAYIVVLFSILVQGLSFQRVVRMVVPKGPTDIPVNDH